MSSTLLHMSQPQSSIAFPSSPPTSVPSPSSAPTSPPSSQRTYSQASNTAGSPLPSIPRRTSFRSNHPPSFAELSISSNAAATAQRDELSSLPIPIPQPLLNDSDTGSSSSPPENGPITFIPSSKRNPPVVITQAPSPPRAGTSAPTPTPAPIGSPTYRKKPDQHRGHPDFNPKRRSSLRPSNESSSDEGNAKPLLLKSPKLRLNLGGLHTRNLSESQINTKKLTVDPVVKVALSAAPEPSKALDGTLRKKSGEIVKPSLKSAKRPTSIAIPDARTIFPQSAPTTPGAKAVHFDSKLERVKLFLAEQKPLAVSRDGSPTDDTSGTETEGFPFPSAYMTRAQVLQRKQQDEKQIEMRLQNMPAPLAQTTAGGRVDVSLQTIAFASEQRTISGRVRVRNLAYEKRVVVRFTLDGWQTASEITARFADSIERGAYDDFSFTIRLHDFWAHIEDKTMVLAVRYNVAGKELWDNNAGANYVARFVRVEPPSQPESKPAAVMHRQESSEQEQEAMMGDLKNRLEQVAKDRRDAPSPTTSFQSLPRRPGERPPSLSSARYDFASASRSPWKFNTVSSPWQSNANGHARTHTFPSSISSVNNNHPGSSSSNSNSSKSLSVNPSVPWPSKTSPAVSPLPRPRAALPSPRDTEEATYDRHGAPVWDRAQIEDLPFASPASPTMRPGPSIGLGLSVSPPKSGAGLTGPSPVPTRPGPGTGTGTSAGPGLSTSPPKSIASPSSAAAARPKLGLNTSPPRERRHRRSYNEVDSPVAAPTLRRTPVGSPIDVPSELPFDGVFAAETVPHMRVSPLPSPALHEGAAAPSSSSKQGPDSYFSSSVWGAPAVPAPSVVDSTIKTELNASLHPSINVSASGSSEDSTPSVTSQSSSASSPMVSPAGDWGLYSDLSSAFAPTAAGTGSHKDGYSQFLNQFCFYTGSNSMLEPPPPPDAVPRSASTSDVEGLLWTSSSSSPGAALAPPASKDSAQTPARAVSWDDVRSSSSTSGAATPKGKQPSSSSSSTPSATTPTGG
ncbi:carbohydrate-binding module family 21 protein [Coniophora puteana RWD-64-598 SS2]|uniref:Carbohydrate-binding module family 21 protein n=1 Tax=Coniophora puteana (strain RWD-64-598) TaxID=741705 RepID=A0A5M3N3H1_CONPW|nr:carbohydrate-binding module family 21 protein [Coniophora puteana RWD-64-598 SS2]EIW85564.1 carbohydrate-binding module family 21 protein [Coniophora puteana RWD-64-598 SS2]